MTAADGDHAETSYTQLKSVKTRNVTLALPEELLRELKIVAAKQDTSLSALLSRALHQIVSDEEARKEPTGRCWPTSREGIQARHGRKDRLDAELAA